MTTEGKHSRAGARRTGQTARLQTFAAEVRAWASGLPEGSSERARAQAIADEFDQIARDVEAGTRDGG